MEKDFWILMLETNGCLQLYVNEICKPEYWEPSKQNILTYYPKDTKSLLSLKYILLFFRRGPSPFYFLFNHETNSEVPYDAEHTNMERLKEEKDFQCIFGYILFILFWWEMLTLWEKSLCSWWDDKDAAFTSTSWHCGSLVNPVTGSEESSSPANNSPCAEAHLLGFTVLAPQPSAILHTLLIEEARCESDPSLGSCQLSCNTAR